jgi:hypothetical protein
MMTIIESSSCHVFKICSIIINHDMLDAPSTPVDTYSDSVWNKWITKDYMANGHMVRALWFSDTVRSQLQRALFFGTKWWSLRNYPHIELPPLASSSSCFFCRVGPSNWKGALQRCFLQPQHDLLVVGNLEEPIINMSKSCLFYFLIIINNSKPRQCFTVFPPPFVTA